MRTDLPAFAGARDGLSKREYAAIHLAAGYLASHAGENVPMPPDEKVATGMRHDETQGACQMTRLLITLKKHKACSDGLAWVMASKCRTKSSAWLKCERPDWMLWALDAEGKIDEQKNRQFMAWCARNTPLGDGRTTRDLLLADERSRAAVELAERMASGEKITDAARSAAESAASNALRSIYGNPFAKGSK